MKELIEALRATIISVETLVLLVVGAVLFHKPEWLSRFGALVASDKDAHSYLVGMATTLLAASVAYSWKLLFPKESTTVLTEWPGFWRLKQRTVLCLIWCALAFIAVLLAVLLRAILPHEAVGGLIGGGLVIAAAVVFQQVIAALTVRQLIDQAR